MSRVAAVVVIVLGCLALGGCARNVVATPNPLDIDPAEYDRLYRAAQAVLRDHGFGLDRQDYRFGRITTQPLDAPTIAEPWRRTNTTARQALIATVNHYRRIATIAFVPVGEPVAEPVAAAPTPVAESNALVQITVDDESAAAATPAEGEAVESLPAAPAYLMHVEVYLEQLQAPTHRLSGSTDPPHVISALGATPTELRERGIQGAYWQPMGRDPYLEQRLMREIVRRSITIR